MAKKNKQKPVQNSAGVKQSVTETPVIIGPPPPKGPLTLYDFKLQAIIVAVLAFLFYCNSFSNEYAHDDGIVIVKNDYVHEGFAGIGSILTTDAFDSYYRQLNTSNQLSGGRYRPLSIVTFAIEQQFMGTTSQKMADSIIKQNIAHGMKGKEEEQLISNMHVRHVVNVLFYMACVVVLLYFLRYIVFKESPIMAFVAAILFTIHPIHTEVVANVKSRDEIMSLLLICTTFILDFKYRETKNINLFFAALVCYFMAFLSKEYAITLVVLLPLAHILFNRYSIQKSIIAFLPYVLVIVGYLALRFSIVTAQGENSESEVLNNPYLFASPVDKLATEISTSLNYLKLLIFPHPLSADYSYSSIPYKSFANPLVWLSLIIHGGMVVIMFRFLFKCISGDSKIEVMGLKQASTTRKGMEGIICFAIAIYLLHLLLVCNIFFDIGATMGERLIFHSSVGFAIAAAYLLVKGFEKIQPVGVSQKALIGVMGVLIILAGIKTVTRNADWKNDTTLFAADIKTVPNSVLVCANVAASQITQADSKEGKAKEECLKRAVALLDHALSIHPDMVASYMNRGIAYYKMGDMDRAKANLDSVKKRYPTYPTLPGIYKLISEDINRQGWEKYGKAKMYPEAIAEFKKGLTIDSSNADLWYNLGGAYYSSGQIPEAQQAWRIALKLKPDYLNAMAGLAAIETTNADLWFNLAVMYYNNKIYKNAANAFGVVLKLKPDNVKAQQGYQACVAELQKNPQ